MKLVCNECGASYSIADEKLVGRGFKMRCRRCSATIVVCGPGYAPGASNPVPPPPDEER